MVTFDQHTALKTTLRERLGSRRFKILQKTVQFRFENAGTLIVEAETPALAAWLDLQWRDDIERAAEIAFGEPVTVSFTCGAAEERSAAA